MKTTWTRSLILLALLANTLQAKEGDKYAGLEWYGASVKYDVNDKITAQAIGGLWGYSNLKSITGKGIYKIGTQKITKKHNFTYYGYGSVTAWMWDNGIQNETVYGFGVGGGVEYDIRNIKKDLPPIFLNTDIGLQVANFSYYGGFNRPAVNVGVHYKF